jgi:hypothetical protein
MKFPWSRTGLPPRRDTSFLDEANKTVEISSLKGVAKMSSTTSSVGTLLSGLFAALKAGLAQSAIPPIITFLENTKGFNPLSLTGQLSYIAQLDLLRSSLMANLTTSLPTEITNINNAISNELQEWLQKALASAGGTAAVAAPVAGVTAS